MARFGGDEFIVLLSEIGADKAQATEQARGVAEKIRFSLGEPYFLPIEKPGLPVKTIEHQCSTSIRVVVFQNHMSSQTDLIKWADAALYKAKGAGGNAVHFFQ